MSANDSLVMPTQGGLEVFDDPTLHRRQKAGFYCWQKQGFACLDNRSLCLGVIDRSIT
jgi:hypothetical protein